jgi:hypothetical protein
MLLESAYNGLSIYRADHSEREAVIKRIGGEFESADLFLIGNSANSFVVSGPPSWHEDEGSYRDPSFFESMLLL